MSKRFGRYQKKRSFWVWVVSCCVLVGSLNLAAQAANEKDQVEAQLKAAIVDSQKNLGPLESWQKTIFSDEVVPQFQRFIRDYSSSQDGLRIEVDYKSLRQYLLFYAPKSLSDLEKVGAKTEVKLGDKRKILVLLKPESSCEKCMASVPEMTKLVQTRLERRGLAPVWMNIGDLPPQAQQPLQIEEVLNSRVSTVNSNGSLNGNSKALVGSLLIYWAPAPVDDLDTAHADDKRFVLKSSLQLKGTFQIKRDKEILDNETFEVAQARLLTDIFTDLGSKIESEQAMLAQGVADTGREEVLIEITGIRDFAQFIRIKNILQTQLKDISSVEDRKFNKTQVTFSVQTKKGSTDIQKQVTGISLDPGNDQTLTVVVR